MTLLMDLLAAQAGVTEVGCRVGWWVARMPVKEAAARFGADARTVKAWRAGCMPAHRHLLAMVRLWGRPFLDHVFTPVLQLDGDEDAFELRLSRAAAEIDALKDQLRHDKAEAARGVGRRPPAPVAGGAAHRDGAAVAVAEHPAELSSVRWQVLRRVTGLGLAIALLVLCATAADHQEWARSAPRAPIARVTVRTLGGGRGQV